MATSARSTRPAVLEDEETVEEETAPVRRSKRGKRDQDENDQQAKGRLRNAAERFVLNEHRDEYYAKLEELHKAEGREYKRVLTPEEKDEKALQEILERNPNLKAKLVQEAQPEAVTQESATRPVSDSPQA